jgi:hypothetical protein
MEIPSMTTHAVNRMRERNVSHRDLMTALQGRKSRVEGGFVCQCRNLVVVLDASQRRVLTLYWKGE